MSAAIITLVATEVVLPIAKSLIGKLSNSSGSTEKFQKTIELVQGGSSAMNALRDTFGTDFDAALTQVANSGREDWSYESGRSGYVSLAEVGDETRSIQVLRDELSINLDRIRSYGRTNKTEMHNYFKGVFGRWKERYIELLGLDEDAQQTFQTIDTLLDGKKKSMKDALTLLMGTGLGVSGALLIVSGVLLATSTGVGVATMISTFLFGIPMLTVAGLVVPGVILVALSRKVFTTQYAMSTCVGVATKLLDRRRDSATVN